MATRPYDPVGALGGMFAPAFIRGDPVSESAFERWLSAHLKRRPNQNDFNPPPPGPKPDVDPFGTSSEDPRTAITRSIIEASRGGGGGSGSDAGVGSGIGSGFGDVGLGTGTPSVGTPVSLSPPPTMDPPAFAPPVEAPNTPQAPPAPQAVAAVNPNAIAPPEQAAMTPPMGVPNPTMAPPLGFQNTFDVVNEVTSPHSTMPAQSISPAYSPPAQTAALSPPNAVAPPEQPAMSAPMAAPNVAPPNPSLSPEVTVEPNENDQAIGYAHSVTNAVNAQQMDNPLGMPAPTPATQSFSPNYSSVNTTEQAPNTATFGMPAVDAMGNPTGFSTSMSQSITDAQEEAEAAQAAAMAEAAAIGYGPVSGLDAPIGGVPAGVPATATATSFGNLGTVDAPAPTSMGPQGYGFGYGTPVSQEEAQAAMNAAIEDATIGYGVSTNDMPGMTGYDTFSEAMADNPDAYSDAPGFGSVPSYGDVSYGGFDVGYGDTPDGMGGIGSDAAGSASSAAAATAAAEASNPGIGDEGDAPGVGTGEGSDGEGGVGSGVGMGDSAASDGTDGEGDGDGDGGDGDE